MKLIPVTARVTPLIVALCLTAQIASAEVSIDGLKGKAKDNVRLMLSMEKENCDAPEWKIRGLYAKADQEIDQGLRALGYYHVVIKKTLVFGKACWQTDIDINTGPRVYVNDVSITFNGAAYDDPEFQKLRDKLLKTAGSPLDHGQYERMKSRIQSLALERGYLQGTFTEKNC